MKKTLVILFLLYSLIINAQVTYTLYEKEYGTPIVNAEILSTNTTLLAYTDENGSFKVDKDVKLVIVSSPDFDDKFVQLNPSNPTMHLDVNYILSEIEVRPNSDAAKKLIREVMRKTKSNKADNLDSYQYIEYNKIVFDSNPDSINIDKNSLVTRLDSLQYEDKKRLERSSIFIWEKIIENRHDSRYGDQSEVVAQKMAGLKNPIYELLAIQPNSHYLEKDQFNFFMKKFVNPVSTLGLNTYRYSITDTILINNRPTISVYFTPKSEEDFEKDKSAIMGYINVDQEDKAIKEFYAERTFDPFAYMKLEWDKKEGYYFPSKKYYLIEILPSRKSPNKEPTNNGKSAKKSDSTPPKAPKRNPNESQVKLIAYDEPPVWVEYTSNFKNFEIPKEFEKKEFKGYEFAISPTLKKDSDEILSVSRDSLTKRESENYPVLDSIFQANHVERYLKFHHILTRGTVPLGNLLEFDLLSAVQFNRYEGWRLEANFNTNENFSKKWRIKGYGAYGFRDKAFKYGGTLSYLVSPNRSGNAYVQYKSDVFPYGRYRPNFFYDKTMLAVLVNNYYYYQFYHSNRFSFGYEQDFIKNVTMDFYMEWGDEYSPIAYSYNFNPVDMHYKMVNMHLSAIWKPFTKYLKTPYGKITIANKPSYLAVHLMKSFGDWGSDFDYESIETMFSHEFNHKFGNFILFGKGGYIWGNAPLYHNFEGGGNAHVTDKKPSQHISFSGFRLFETMQASRFYMNRYIQFQLYQNFPKFRLGSRKVQSSIFYKGEWGGQNNAPHVLIPVQAPVDYYQEIGAEMKNLLLGFGVGAYYRIGNYHIGNFDDNFYFKLNFTLNMSLNQN